MRPSIRGTIFGYDLVFQLSSAFKHYEVTKFVGLGDTGLVLTCATAMSTKLWDSLPKETSGHHHASQAGLCIPPC